MVGRGVVGGGVVAVRDVVRGVGAERAGAGSGWVLEGLAVCGGATATVMGDVLYTETHMRQILTS